MIIVCVICVIIMSNIFIIIICLWKHFS